MANNRRINLPEELFGIAHFKSLPSIPENNQRFMTPKECADILCRNPGCDLDGDIDEKTAKPFNVLTGIIEI